MAPRTSLLLLGFLAVLGLVVVWLGSPVADPERAGSRFVFEQGPREASQLTSIFLLTRAGVHARAERRDGRWWIVEPIEAPGNEEELEALAGGLAALRSESMIESPPDTSIYGIASDSQRVRFTMGGVEREIQLGSKTPVGENSYVFEPVSSHVFLVPTRDVDRFSVDLDSLRDRRVARFDPGLVDRIEVRRPDAEPIGLERASSGWAIVDPMAAPADSDRVEQLLSALAFLRAEAFIDGPAAGADAMDVVPEVEFVLASAVDPDSGEADASRRIVVARSDGGPVRVVKGDRDALFEVASEKVFDLPSTLDDFRQKSLSRFDMQDAAFYEVVFRPPGEGAVTVGMERREEGWHSTTPQAMAAGTSSRLLAALSDLDAEEIVAEGAGSEERKGLGLLPAAVTIRVFARDGDAGALQPLAEIHLGRDEGVKGILAQRTGDPRVYRLSAEHRRAMPIHYGAFLEGFVSRESPPP